MIKLDDYLDYLHEQGVAGVVAKMAKPVGKIIVKSASNAAVWTAAIASATVALKALKFALSGAARKCGAGMFKKETAGVKVCIAKEKIRILQQEIRVYSNLLSKCNSTKNPQICKEKYRIKIQKSKNKILINQGRIKQTLGVEEQLSIAKVGVAALGLATWMLVDKIIFGLNRTVAAAFSEAVRKCGIYKEGPERNICITKSKLIILNKKLIKLRSLNPKCIKEKNPEKCREKLSKHLNKTLRDMQILKDSLRSYQNELETKKREERLKAEMKESSKKQNETT